MFLTAVQYSFHMLQGFQIINHKNNVKIVEIFFYSEESFQQLNPIGFHVNFCKTNGIHCNGTLIDISIIGIRH